MTAGAGSVPARSTPVKCVVWDLDDTLWDGVLLEDDEVVVRERVVELIRCLDQVGILNSVASKNDGNLAMARLEAAGIAELFLFPQINWSPKSASIRAIARSLDVGTETLAFVDDQPFELAEVRHTLPEVLGVHVNDIDVLTQPELRPRFVTGESRHRRRMYLANIEREEAEHEFTGTSEEFLASLGMHMVIRQATEDDLQRAEELTVRTSQLNSTGRPLSYEELDAMRLSAHHLLLVATLEDRFGAYGTIGLALVKTTQPNWTLRLLLTSCRVISRGVGTVLLNHVMRLARDDGATLLAEFVPTGRNRMMHLTYVFAGFTEIGRDHAGGVVLRSRLDRIQPPPPYLDLEVHL